MLEQVKNNEFFQGKNPTAGGYTFEFLGEAQ